VRFMGPVFCLQVAYAVKTAIAPDPFGAARLNF